MASLHGNVRAWSRPSGVARPDSDYDVAVFLWDYARPWLELDPLSDITTEILFDTGAIISVLPLPARAYRNPTIWLCLR